MATRDEIKQAMVNRVVTEGLVGPDGQPMPAMNSVLEAVTDGIVLVEGGGPHASSHITGGSDVIPDAVPGGASGLMSGTDKAKLDGIEPGAQVNQNAFSYVRVGATIIEADSKTDTLELAAGSNIALTPDAANDKVTIALVGTVPSAQNADTVDNKHASDFALLGHGHTGGTDGNQIGTSGLQDGVVTDAKIGNRTADQAQAPTGSTGTLTQLLSWLANRIKAITGAANWFDNPAATLAAIWAKFHASTGHKHTGAADDGPQIDYANITGKPTSFVPSAHKSTHASGGSDALTPGDIGAIPFSEKGQPNGVATLDSGGKVPESQLPPIAGMEVHGNEWHDPDFETPSGAQTKVDSHAATNQTHGASGSYRLAKTSRADQLPAWGDIPDKPSSFTPSAHKSTHASGGSDALTPGDIGAVPVAGGTMTGTLTVENALRGYVVTANRYPVGLEHNILFKADLRYTVSQTGPAPITLSWLFDGKLEPTYSAAAPTLDNPQVILIEGLPAVHTQVGAWVGWTTRYWPLRRFKIEGYDEYLGYNNWRVIADYSATDYSLSDFIAKVPVNGIYTKLKFTIYQGQETSGKYGLSEIFFIHPEVGRPYDWIIANLAPGATVDGNTIWHAGNDGAGSGLVADMVDDAHAGNSANNVLKLDASGLVPLSNIPSTLTGKDADTVDGKHASELGIPRGVIVMWSGAADAIPDGWALCDGTNGTPDLRDRFIVGAGGAYSVGATGGASSVTLSVDQIPIHTHSASSNTAGSHSHTGSAASSGDHSHTVSVRFRGSGATRWTFDNMGTTPGTLTTSINGAHTHSLTIDSSGAHSHTISVASAGGGQAHENRPPYYALCFIMKL